MMEPRVWNEKLKRWQEPHENVSRLNGRSSYGLQSTPSLVSVCASEVGLEPV